jgi:hypothetical protein
MVGGYLTAFDNFNDLDHPPIRRIIDTEHSQGRGSLLKKFSAHGYQRHSSRTRLRKAQEECGFRILWLGASKLLEISKD